MAKASDDNGVEVVGLMSVRKLPKPHTWSRSPRMYDYKMADGCTMTMLTPIKGAKDLREYGDKHPKRQGFIDWCQRWQPVPQLFSSSAQAWAYGSAPAWFKPRR